MLLFSVIGVVLCDDILFRKRLSTPIAYGLLGITQGLGFWVQPAIISFTLAIWLIVLVREQKGILSFAFPVLILCFAVGALPAIAFNMSPDLRAVEGLKEFRHSLFSRFGWGFALGIRNWIPEKNDGNRVTGILVCGGP